MVSLSRISKVFKWYGDKVSFSSHPTDICSGTQDKDGRFVSVAFFGFEIAVALVSKWCPKVL